MNDLRKLIDDSNNMDMWEDGTVEIVIGKKLAEAIDSARCISCNSILVKARSDLHFRIKSNPMLHGMMVGCECGIKYHLRTDADNYTYA